MAAPTLDASLSPGGANSTLNISDAVSASLEVLQLRQENDGLKNDVKDLEEKLETLKLKRQEWNSYVSHFSQWERDNTLDV